MDRLVSGSWLEKELGAPDLCVLDCGVRMEAVPDGGLNYRSGRPAWERSHIPGAAHLDLLQEGSDTSSPFLFTLPPPDQFAAVMSKVGVGDGTRVVLYDAGMNAWAARLWWMLRAHGFDEAAVLDGGWRAWINDGRPTSTEAPPERPPGTFIVRTRPGIFVGKDEVLGAINSGEVRIVDALPREMYRGARQAYGRPGHIPGAHNVPFVELVDADTHRYLPHERLSATYSDVLAAKPERVITYCGSGIAAASDAFALTLLGLENVAIYDGSMSEWASDPSLPLVTGDEPGRFTAQ